MPLVVIERLASDFARDNKRKSVEQKKRWLMDRVSALDKVKKVRKTYILGARRWSDDVCVSTISTRTSAGHGKVTCSASS